MMIESRDKMTAIVCGTPYQLFNALNIIHNTEAESFDVYIFNRFKDAERLTECLRTIPAIKNAILINDYQKDCVKGHKLTGFIKNCHSAYIYMRPQNSIKPYFNDCEDWQYAKQKNRYSRILAPTPSFFLQCLEKINNKAVLDYFEDGLLSYVGNVDSDSASIERKIFSKLFRVGYNVIQVKSLFVYRPDVCKSTVANRLEKLTSIDTPFLEFISPIFKTNRERIDSKVIWLTQTAFLPMDKELLSDLQKACIKPLIRMHPKDRHIEEYRDLGFNIDNGEELWEVCLSKLNLNDTVLISMNSTALLTPKLLYNQEPTIVFTYKLYGIIEGFFEEKDRFITAEFIKTIRQLYSHKERIIVPSTREEFIQFIESLAID